MSTMPRLGLTELVASQAVPENKVNELGRYLEQGASFYIVKDKDLATPPGSPTEGDAYIVAASPTGAWTGWANRIAFKMSTAWEDITPLEGSFAYIQDEDLVYRYTGSAWVLFVPKGKAPTSQTGTTYTAVADDAEGYIQFNNAGAITFTIPANSSVAYPLGTLISWEQLGAGVVTVAGAGGVTLNSRGALLNTNGQYAVVHAKKVGTDTWTVYGDRA